MAVVFPKGNLIYARKQEGWSITKLRPKTFKCEVCYIFKWVIEMIQLVKIVWLWKNFLAVNNIRSIGDIVKRQKHKDSKTP